MQAYWINDGVMKISTPWKEKHILPMTSSVVLICKLPHMQIHPHSKVCFDFPGSDFPVVTNSSDDFLFLHVAMEGSIL